MNPKVLSIGCLSLDSIQVKKYTQKCFGGAALYAALGSSCFIKTGIISTIGLDYPIEFLKYLNTLKINTDCIFKSTKTSSHFEITYDNSWNETYNSAEFILGHIVSEGIKPYIRDANMLIINSMKPELQKKWWNIARKSHLKTAFSTNLLFTENRSDRELLRIMINGATFFVCNMREASNFCETSSIDEILDQFSAIVEIPVITNGSGLVYFKVKGQNYTRETKKITVIDPTGCGDTFLGALVGSYLLSNDIIKSIDIAIEASAFTASDFGPNCLLDQSKRNVLSQTFSTSVY